MENVKYIPGDLVRDPFQNGKICIVKSVEYNNDMCFTQVVGTTQCALSRFNALKVIPLTQEFLENNNWKHDGEWLRFTTGKSFLYIIESSSQKGNYLVCVGDDKHYIANISYIHQLQHLLFGLGLDSNLKV